MGALVYRLLFRSPFDGDLMIPQETKGHFLRKEKALNVHFSPFAFCHLRLPGFIRGY